MRGVKGSRKPEMAACHPERKNHAKGQCWTCWTDERDLRRATCHPERRISSRGLCQSCYHALLKKLNPEFAKNQAALGKAWYQAKKGDPAFKERVRLNGRAHFMQKTYGWTLEQYADFLQRHGHSCDICGGAHRLCVDHDHQTGVVRGLLCHHCNLSLGLAKDDPLRLEAAAAYLRLHHANRPAKAA